MTRRLLPDLNLKIFSRKPPSRISPVSISGTKYRMSYTSPHAFGLSLSYFPCTKVCVCHVMVHFSEQPFTLVAQSLDEKDGLGKDINRAQIEKEIPLRLYFHSGRLKNYDWSLGSLRVELHYDPRAPGSPVYSNRCAS